ncbi:MAG: GFA family protein [Wenzhouxiangellaceae bacterium]
MMNQYQAQCSCQQLSLVAEAEPVRVSLCHCLACQRRTGSTYGVQARFPADKVRISGRHTEFQRRGDSGSTASFCFCPVCGATVFFRLEQQPDLIGVPVGVLADPQFPQPSVSVYEEYQHPWVVLPDAIEHYD